VSPITEVLVVDHSAPSVGQIDTAAARLRAGLLVAFPTETVYGLGALAGDRDAVRSVFAAKGRPATDPLIVHAPSVEGLAGVVRRWSDEATELARQFWPGPLTMVLERTDAMVPEVSAGRSTVAVRVPAHPVALALLAAVGEPVAAPSANRFGQISPTSAAHVLDELDGRIDLVLDGGPTTLGIESTVIDLTGGRPVLLRPGGVTFEDLRRVLGDIDHPELVAESESVPAAAPGRFLRHYAPRTPLVLVDGPPEVVAALVDELGRRGQVVGVVALAESPGAAARQLYARLRAADGKGDALLVATSVDPTGIGRAVNDRLYRAAHGRVVLDADLSTVDRLVALVELGRS